MKKFLGLALMVAAAFVFLSAYQSISWAFYADTFDYDLYYGAWGTPSRALYSTLQILVVIGLASVLMSAAHDRLEYRDSGKLAPVWAMVLVMIVPFALLHWWSTPFIRFVAFCQDIHGSDSLFVGETWVINFYALGRESIFAYALATPAILFTAALRRKIDNTSFPTLSGVFRRLQAQARRPYKALGETRDERPDSSVQLVTMEN